MHIEVWTKCVRCEGSGNWGNPVIVSEGRKYYLECSGCNASDMAHKHPGFVRTLVPLVAALKQAQEAS